MMANVKTAISLSKPLLEQVDATAKEMKIPRSRLFVLAVEAFLRRRENERLLETINKVYDEQPPTERELAQLREMQRLYTATLEDEAW
jgi:metal-responsive CopG/Arc/MetJ family transcriptional regulator